MVHSFIHSCTPTGPSDSSLHLFAQLVEEVSGYCLRMQSRKTIPSCKGWGYWTVESQAQDRMVQANYLLNALGKQTNELLHFLEERDTNPQVFLG